MAMPSKPGPSLKGQKFLSPRFSILVFSGRNTASETRMGLIKVEIDSIMLLPKKEPWIDAPMLEREIKNSKPPKAYAETIINRKTAIRFSGDADSRGVKKRNLVDRRTEQLALKPKANVEVPMTPSARNGRHCKHSKHRRTG